MAPEPFRIYDLAGYETGTLALCRQPEADMDFDTIAAWHPTCVVTLTTEMEFPKIGQFLPLRFLEAHYDWLHLPITDFGAPPEEETEIWQDALKQLLDILKNDGRILAHCHGGQGRSGMLVLKLLTLQGEGKEKALKRLRAARPGAVETNAQYDWATQPL